MNPSTYWTGGQYSLVRAVLGIYLLGYLLSRITEGDPSSSFSMLCLLGSAAATALILGWHDRGAAVLLWGICSFFLLKDGIALNKGSLLISLLLLAHWMIREAPFGALRERTRDDPRGSWKFPQELYVLLWLTLAVFSVYSGMGSLSLNDAGSSREILGWCSLLLGAGLALALRFPSFQFPVWICSLTFQFIYALVTGETRQPIEAAIFHLFIFNPGWVSPRGVISQVLYDGECALCHGMVRFILSEQSPFPARTIFSPLQSEEIKAKYSAQVLPDSIVVVTEQETLLVKSEATIAILQSLGGYWRIVALLLYSLPRAVRDFGYDLVASNRKRIFGVVSRSCPLLPDDLKERIRL